MSIALTLLGGVLVVFAITALTGYFVAQEFAYMSVDRSRLAAAAEGGDAAAVRTLSVTKRTSFMLSGAQLGITLTGLLVGYVAEPLIGRSLGQMLGGVGITPGLAAAVGAAIALLFATFVQMLFGELFPKNLAIALPEPVARRLSRSTTIYLTLFGWLITIFDKSSNALLRVLKIEPVHDVEHSASPRDLEHIVRQSRSSGDLPAELSTLLDRILDFPSRTVEHAMVPRSRVAAVNGSDSIASVRRSMSTAHSRYPVVGDDDAIVGVVSLQGVLATALSDTAPARDIAMSATILVTTQSLPAALTSLRAPTSEMACVVDEYGGFVGIVTLEDLAEELIGDIDDEHDAEIGAQIVERDGRWTVPGDTAFDELSRTVQLDLPEGDYETVAGWAISLHGGLPEVDEVVSVTLDHDEDDLVFHQITMTVLEIDRHVPAVVDVAVTRKVVQR